MARLHRFDAGYCTHPACIALSGGRWAVCRFPSRAWLIEAGGKRWLWDTGYAAHFYDHTRSGLFSLYRKLTPVYFDPDDAMCRQLQAQGLAVRDLDGLILSHFHGDHIAGLRDFPGLPILCSGRGWQQLRHLRGVAALRRAFVPGLIPPDFEARMQAVEALPECALPAELAPFSHGWVLPGSAGEVLLLPLPGHAEGHIGAFVQTDDGWVLLAADAAWSARGYRELRGPARIAHLLMADTADYYRTLRQLQQLDAGGAAQIALCHEGEL